MKKIKLYDYQQKMLEDIINVLTSDATSTFYNENGKKERVGSSVMDDIIVKPIYAHISDFRGDYAQCRIGIQKCLYGLLDRRGNIILPPEYKYIYRWNEHAVEVKGNDGYCRTIEL